MVPRQPDCPLLQSEPMYMFADFPSQAWVNGRKWKVNKITKPIVLDGNEYIGMTYCPGFTLPVNWVKMFSMDVYVRQEKMEVKRTLIHELLHAASMCDDQMFMSRHQFITSTATDLTLILADPRNHDVVAYLSQ